MTNGEESARGGNIAAVLGSLVLVVLSVQPLISMIDVHQGLSQEDLKAQAAAEDVAQDVKDATETVVAATEDAQALADDIADATGDPATAQVAEEGVGQLVASIENAEDEAKQASSGTRALRQEKSGVVQVLWKRWTTGAELLSLWLVVVAGVLGGAIRSFYLGSLKYTTKRWEPRFWLWYTGRPVLGASVALVVYAGVRGGLLNVGIDSAKLNAYGLVFVAAVSGLYGGKVIERLGRLKGLTELEEA
ncbi:MAG TPA: hypothetical protein VI916_13345 [Acidimicrobiia bacterium]|nr:hypothetical protein [Acidimicrobiia bacterium]